MKRLKRTLSVLMLLPLVLVVGCGSMVEVRIVTKTAMPAPTNTPTPTDRLHRISVSSDGSQSNGWAYSPSISDNGRYVAFYSIASNLIIDDTNGWADVFVRDREMNSTTIVSIALDGTLGNGLSGDPSISSDGRYVAFESSATNLVSSEVITDTNNTSDVFLHDRETGETILVSIATDSTYGNSTSYSPSISSDGRFVAFQSDASNLVDHDANRLRDIFVFDRLITSTIRVSIASNGMEGNGSSWVPSISADGRYVAFSSDADNLIGNDTNGDGFCDIGCDTNGWSDVFVHDLQTGETIIISIASDGSQGNKQSNSPSISSDGKYVAFMSEASNLASNDSNICKDIFVHDLQTNQTTLISVSTDGIPGNADSVLPSISPDGRFVAFRSKANNLVIDDANSCPPFTRCPDIFVHDRLLGETSRVSVGTNGAEGNRVSDYPSVSTDGRYVAFQSDANNLVSGDTNYATDIFIYER